MEPEETMLSIESELAESPGQAGFAHHCDPSTWPIAWKIIGSIPDTVLKGKNGGVRGAGEADYLSFTAPSHD